MKNITLKNINRKLAFATVANAARQTARTQRCLVRFTMGPKGARQTFTASPKKPLATLVWEWSRSKAGMMARQPARKALPGFQKVHPRPGKAGPAGRGVTTTIRPGKTGRIFV